MLCGLGDGMGSWLAGMANGSALASSGKPANRNKSCKPVLSRVNQPRRTSLIPKARQTHDNRADQLRWSHKAFLTH